MVNCNDELAQMYKDQENMTKEEYGKKYRTGFKYQCPACNATVFEKESVKEKNGDKSCPVCGLIFPTV